MDEQQPTNTIRGGVDPLSAMYFIAALLMGAAAIAVVVLMLLPRGSATAGGPDVFVPGAVVEEDVPVPAPAPTGEAARVAEELHMH